MRMPQDRVLHIDTEIKNGKVNVVAEWQGELVRCKDCKHRDEKCGMGEHRWCRILNMSTVPNDFCSYGERKGGDLE